MPASARQLLLIVVWGVLGVSVAQSVFAETVNVSPTKVTLQVNGSQQFTATTGSGAAVHWSLTCSSIPCGSVTPSATSSGVPTTYRAPYTLPAADLNVTITATSTSDATQSSSASVTISQIPGFTGVSEAHVDSINGVTRLVVNGKPMPPLQFMFAEPYPGRQQYLAPQVMDASASGIHLYQTWIGTDWPWDNQGTAPLDFSNADHDLDNFTAVDPTALLVVRVDIWPGNGGTGWKPPVPLTSADYTLYADGQTADFYHLSMASDTLFNGFLTSVPHLLQHFENSSYASHIVGYIVSGGNTGEWFWVDYRERGPDYSPVNTQAFQKWLLNKYGTDAALSAAWGRPVTIATAQVPRSDPGRFPMRGSTGEIDVFYKLPDEQDWVDYSSYTSDLASQRILDIAQVVRTQTGGKRLIGFFNDYLFDLPGSFSGHLRDDRLLSSPNIDFLCAPYTYQPLQDRLAGGGGGSMSPVDSVAEHGKLWFNENDLNTYLSAASGLPPINPANGNIPTKDLTETVDVLDRYTAGLLIHRSGAWWMDANQDGAFNDPAIWTTPMSQHGIPLFNKLYADPRPYRPDVALIVDRASVVYQKSDWDAADGLRMELRNILAKSGVAFGSYDLSDFINDTSPPCKVYIFVNAFYLTDAEITQIQSRLNAEGATAIWQYAAGLLGPNGPDLTRIAVLTGIQVGQSDGHGVTIGSGAMAGYNWGYTGNVVSPRLVVTDPAAEILGRYQADGQISSARKKVQNFESVFIGEFGILTNSKGNFTPDALRALLKMAGVHIWSVAGDVIQTDGNLLVIHAAAPGLDMISLPTGVSATPLGGGVPSTGTLNVTFSRTGETQWFQLSQTPSLTALALTAGTNPSTAGQVLTFAAQVTPPSATGVVQFMDAGNLIGVASVTNANALLPGVSLSAGTHTITAAYSGDYYLAPSISAPITQIVLTAGASIGSTTTLTVSPAHTFFRQPVTFSISVTPGSGSAARGSVVLVDGMVQLGPVLQLDAQGQATYTTPLHPGEHSTVWAAYLGSATINGSSSPTRTANASPKPRPH